MPRKPGWIAPLPLSAITVKVCGAPATASAVPARATEKPTACAGTTVTVTAEVTESESWEAVSV